MQLTDESVREFQEIWKREFGEEVSAGEARQRVHELLEMYVALAKDEGVVKYLRETGLL